MADEVNNRGNLIAPKGIIRLEGKDITFSGKAIASAGKVEILGRETVALLDNATINVSSFTDAGTILIGGDWQGKGEINSLRTYVGTNVNLKADALINGTGDTNIVLQATNDIRLQDLNDDRLDFATGEGLIVFTADADQDGVGDFVMEDNLNDTIFTNGRDIVISGANLTIGSLNTSLLDVPDAGNLIDTALLVSDSSGQNLATIKGNISSGGDIDLFKIYLTGEGTFSASTVNGETNIDTQLFLFNANGLGVYSNDDQGGCFCFQSTLPAGNTLTPQESGIYYLGISTFLVNPFSSKGEIFPDSFTAGFEAIKAPFIFDGVKFPLNKWVGFSSGQGSYTINLTGVEALENTFIESSPRDSGSITLNTSDNVNINGLLKTSLNSDNGGKVEITASNVFLNNSAQILSIANGEGNGGDIKIQTGSLFLLDGSFIETRTLGRGKGGTISITAQDIIEISGENNIGFNNGIRSIVSAGATGDSGGITINTNSLFVKDGGAIDATTFGGGNAGDIVIRATELIEISGEDSDGNPSFIETLNLFATGNSGDITINTGTLSLQGGAFLETSVIFGQGNSGTITITAEDQIELSGESSQGKVSLIRSLVDPDPSAKGNSGRIIINTSSLSLTDGALLDTRAFGEGKAGEININSSKLKMEKGASISAFSGDRGDAGNINLNLAESLFISDDGSGLFADTGKNSIGKGGNIIVNAPLINLENNAAIAVSSLGEGISGDIEIIGKTLNLDNSSITAQTLSSDGGNLNFNLQNLLNLSQNSKITATAGTDQAEGDGGNIAINSPFIISSLSNPLNAITANAFQGQGGNIEINTNFIFGREFLLIDASSELGVDGEVNINDPNIDPTSGFIIVQVHFIDAEGLIARSPCAIEDEQIAGGSSFVVKGRGGLPTTPEETTSNSHWLLEWASPDLDSISPINQTRVNKWLVNNEEPILLNNELFSDVNSCSFLSQ
jgi:large exoprotein involved in heme utilization and adhesion